VLTDLLGPDVLIQTSKLNTKAPGGGAAVEWHQDWAFYPHTNDDMLAVGLMLEDVDEASGPLMAIPGTHRGPVLEHFAGGVFCGAIDPDDPLFDRNKAVTLTGRAGSMTVHHARTLHGSAPNLSDRPRLILFYECLAADAWPLSAANGYMHRLGPAEFWADLQARLVTGSVCLTPRLQQVPVRIPLPPAADTSSLFAIQRSAGAKSAFA
jgi:ectoine hydroxylase-related dioxygenase (phytanoyl-CoA dioxygenase family)